MELSKKDRLILANQYRIMEKLQPELAAVFAAARHAVEGGYELHYDELTRGLLEPLSVEQCRWVLHVLEMFTALRLAYDGLKDKSGIEEWQVRFAGFDPTHEPAYQSYAWYVISDLKKFPELAAAGDHATPAPMLGRYQVMLAEWHRSKDERKLSQADVARITKA